MRIEKVGGKRKGTVVEEEDDFLFFDGYITNVDEGSKKENKDEIIDLVGKDDEEKEKLKSKEDKQMRTAENILRGILLYKS